MSCADLAQEYNQQLQDAGWVLLKQDDNEAGSWSTWKVNSEDNTNWAGRLVFMPSVVDEDLYFGYLNMEQFD